MLVTGEANAGGEIVMAWNAMSKLVAAVVKAIPFFLLLLAGCLSSLILFSLWASNIVGRIPLMLLLGFGAATKAFAILRAL